MISSSLRKQRMLSTINEHMRVARKRFGRSDVLDVLAVFFGDAISGERTREKFSQRIQPFAVLFLAVCGRDPLLSRSALSRFLAAWTEALREMFLDDLLSRPLTSDNHTGSLLDRLRHRRQAGSGSATRLPPSVRRVGCCLRF